MSNDRISVLPKTSGIYSINNMVDGKRYVGSAVNLRYRWHVHKCYINQKRRCNYHLMHAWHKYGEKSFEFEIIELTPKEKLIEREQFWIDVFSGFGEVYNATLVAGSNLGVKFSPEAIKNMKAAAQERYRKNPVGFMRGKKHTEEAKVKIKEANDRSIAAGGGGKKNKGKKHTEETKRKFSEGAKKRTDRDTPEYRENLSRAVKLWWAKRKGQIHE